MDEIIDILISRRQPNIQLMRNILLRDIFDWEQPEEDAPEFYEQFNLDGWTEEDCVSHFRFRKQDIPRLVQALRIPQEIQTKSSHIATGTQALCMLLKRLAYPNCLNDIKTVFGRSIAAMSEIINFVCGLIYQNFNNLLEDLEVHEWLNQEKFRQYANAIVAKGAAIPNCWAFIDGTARAICRPTHEQENYYSGHKRFHCVKYQALVTPDGLTVSLMGGFEGRRHDAGIFGESGLYNQLEQKARFADGSEYVIFGDQAYGIRELLLCPYPGQGLNEAQQHFNASMTPIRQAVEWSFSKVVVEFAFVDFKKNQKLLLQDIEQMYKCATILTNCHSCLYGNQTATFFNINPINLEDYLNIY